MPSALCAMSRHSPAGPSRSPAAWTPASPGDGSTRHVTQRLFKRLAGIELMHVRYRGNGPAFSDIVANTGKATVTPPQEARRNERVRVQAVMSQHRVPGWPDMPTIVEQGFPDLPASTWFGPPAPIAAGM